MGARRPLPDIAAALTRLAGLRDDADDALHDYNPPHYGYQQLRAKLAELRQRRASGEHDALAEIGGDDADVFDDALVSAHKAAGRKKAAPTQSHVEAEILANMERWRWLPRDLGSSRIEVNIPEFELAVIRDGAVTHRAKVIVGKEETPTPCDRSYNQIPAAGVGGCFRLARAGSGCRDSVSCTGAAP